MFTPKYSSARPNPCFSSSSTHRDVSYRLTTAVRRYIDSPRLPTYRETSRVSSEDAPTNHDVLKIHGTVGHLGKRNIVVMLRTVIVLW